MALGSNLGGIVHKRGEDKLTSITASDCELSRKAGAVMDAGSEAQGSEVDDETRLVLAAMVHMVQTVVSQEVGVRDGEQATIVLHRIVINPEMERRNYLIKYEEILMALTKKL